MIRCAANSANCGCARRNKTPKTKRLRARTCSRSKRASPHFTIRTNIRKACTPRTAAQAALFTFRHNGGSYSAFCLCGARTRLPRRPWQDGSAWARTDYFFAGSPRGVLFQPAAEGFRFFFLILCNLFPGRERHLFFRGVVPLPPRTPSLSSSTVGLPLRLARTACFLCSFTAGCCCVCTRAVFLCSSLRVCFCACTRLFSFLF